MSGIAAGLLLLFPAVAAAQPSSSPSPLFAARGAFFAVSVGDLEASANWYAQTFGMRVVMRSPPRDGTAAIVLEGGGLTVELIEDSAAVPLRSAAPSVERDYRIHGLFKAGIVVDDWDALLAGLRARGVPIALGPFPATTEQRANLLIRDLEGNHIQFFGGYATPRP